MENIKANILELMFKHQLDLVNYYQKIEGLPDYPVDINSKEGQRLLKDFGRRFIEELSEAYENLFIANSLMGENKHTQAKSYQEEYNQEISDAWHFLLELCIFAGYGSWESIELLINNYTAENEKWDSLVKQGKPFKSLLNIATSINFNENQRHSGILKFGSYPIVTVREAMDNPCIAGGRNTSPEILQTHAQLLWELTATLNLTLHTLKNKDWKQTEKEVNIRKFEINLIETFLRFAIYLDYAGFGEIGIATNFNLTTKKNLKRIKDGY